MMLITTCPACQTQFEVNDAQLQAHGGQVRCGACEQIFDARSTLQALDAEDAAATRDLPADGHGGVFMAVPDSPPATTDLQQAAPVFEAPASHSGLDAVEDEILASGAEADLPEAARMAEVSVATPVSAPVPSPATADAAVAHDDFATVDAVEAETPPPVPVFLQTAGQLAAAPLSQRQRLGYAVLIVALACLLASQSIYLLRHRLASLFPASQPWLVKMCQRLHCSMGLPRQIQQLVIDDADIQEQPEHADVLVFSSVLINHGDQALAFPDIELTLTGTGDEALFRRRIPPADYLPAERPVAGGIAAHQEVHVQAWLAVEDKRVAGYRVAIDYP